MSGSFGSLTEPASGLAAGTRFDTLYGSNAITLAVTPSFYGNLAAAGVAESSSESAVGSALDAIRPAPGVAMDPARSALFGPLYTLPAGSIAVGLDELAPSIYPDAMITARNSWYLMANAVSGQLAARRGLAADHAANSAPGPNDSTIWVSGLGGYDSIGAGGGSPGFTAGLGGMAAGIDMPVAGTGRVGVAIGTVEGQTWSQASGHANSSTAQFVTYGQWQRGMFFAEAQTRPDVSAGDCASGIAAVRRIDAGRHRRTGRRRWRTHRPAANHRRVADRAERRLRWLPSATGQCRRKPVGRWRRTSAARRLGSAESTLAVSAQHAFALNETVRMTAKGRLGWSHEFADNTARVSASFAGLSGSGFALNSAPIGRDAAVVGLGADINVASWPVAMFVGYGGAFSGSSNAQSFNAGVRFTW